MSATKATNDRQKAISAEGIREWLPKMPFNALLGIRLHRVHKDGVTICCDVEDKLLNGAGVLHGGVTATLADAAVGLATNRHYQGRPITTIELKINYFRPLIPGSRVYARAKLLRTGATLSVGEVEIRDAKKNLAGVAIVTYMLLDTRAKGSAERSTDNNETREADPVLRVKLKSAKGSAERSATNPGSVEADPVLRVTNKRNSK